MVFLSKFYNERELFEISVDPSDNFNGLVISTMVLRTLLYGLNCGLLAIEIDKDVLKLSLHSVDNFIVELRDQRFPHIGLDLAYLSEEFCSLKQT